MMDKSTIEDCEKEANKKLLLFSSRLKGRREELKKTDKWFTIDNVSEFIHVKRGTLRSYESGTTFPSVDKLLLLCEILNCDVDYLIGRIDKNTTKRQNTSDLTGLSEESIQVLESSNSGKKYNEERKYPDNPTYGWQYKNTVYVLDIILQRYPELFEDVGDVLWCYENDSMEYRRARTRIDMVRERRKQMHKIKSMKIALNLFQFLDTGEKRYCNYSDATPKVTKFASDFIYSRISYLEKINDSYHYSQTDYEDDYEE